MRELIAIKHRTAHMAEWSKAADSRSAGETRARSNRAVCTFFNFDHEHLINAIHFYIL